jgi:hypothetical protein
MALGIRILVLTVLFAAASHAVPFWGAKDSQPAETDPASLVPGQFIWEGEAAPSGPIVVVVSITEQRAYVYRNGERVGVSTVSTGRPGHDTPTGVFTVLQKDATHRSKKYNDAPMPDAERLTWDGVALHAGGLPGYPSSHGCVHMPSEFAKLLFEISPLGMTVVIGKEHEAPEEVVHPGALSPVDATTGAVSVAPILAAGQEDRWQPEKASKGPVSIVVSGADRRAIVYRNGIEIGRSRVEIADPGQPLGTHAFVMLEGQGKGPAIQGEPPPRWVAVGIPGHAGEAGRQLDSARASSVRMPPDFTKDLYPVLSPGATLLVTDAPVLEQTTGRGLNVLNADAPIEQD